MLCTKCGKREAVYHRRYSGESLCSRCFLQSVEERVKRTINQYGMFEPEDRIAVAVSGGKDSLTLLQILYKIEQKFPKAELIAITIDEGIGDYRREAIKLVGQLCSRLGVEHHVYTFREIYGYTLDDVVEAGGVEFKPCSYCGVLRRRALNFAARELGATKLAVAHTLDDEAQTIIMNLLRGDPLRLARLKPVSDLVHPRLVRRVKPLCMVPEAETALYAYLARLPYTNRQCPYAHKALRNEVRIFLNRLEFKHPSTKFTIYKAFERIRPAIEATIGEVKLNECKICGEPTPEEICQACQMLKNLPKLKQKRKEGKRNEQS